MGVRIIWQGLPTAVIKTLPEPIMNMFETNLKKKKTESFNKEVEVMMKNQIEILNWKLQKSEIKLEQNKSIKKKESGMGDYSKNSNFYVNWVPGANKKTGLKK